MNIAAKYTESGDYKGAAREYSMVIEYFPASPHKEMAQFMSGVSYMNAGMLREASMEFRLFIINFPESKLKWEARIALSEIDEKFKREFIYIPGKASEVKERYISFGERRAKERAVREKAEAEKEARERVEAKRAEAKRIEEEREAVKRAEAEMLEAERLATERAEAERLESERLEAERLEAERVAREVAEAERLELERLEAERLEAERVAREVAEAERLELERLEAERLEAERVAREVAEAERLESERLELERIVKEEAAAAAKVEEERLEAEWIAREMADLMREEAERIEAELVEEALKAEAELAEAERLEAERLARELSEAAAKAEEERLKAEWVASEIADLMRQEAERIEAEMLEAERVIESRLMPDDESGVAERPEAGRPPSYIDESLPPFERPVGAIHGVQVSYYEWNSLDDIDMEFRELKEDGIDTVIFRVFQNIGDRYHPFIKDLEGAGAEVAGNALPPSGVYFKTAHVPIVADILDEVIRIAHNNGLQLFAWMTTRYANYGIEDKAALGCKGYNLESREVEGCKGLDLFNDDSLTHLKGIYNDLAEYDLDGILFQDDLVLRHTEGFGPFAGEDYIGEFGTSVNPESLYMRKESGGVTYTDIFWQWAEWKNRRLLYIADTIKELVLAKRPGTKFAINLMYESITNPKYALAWLSQDLERATEIGFDYYSVMAYHRQMGSELNKSGDEVRELIKKMVRVSLAMVGDEEKVLMKVQSIDWKTGEPLEVAEVLDIIEAIRGVADVSLAVVPYINPFPYAAVGSDYLKVSGK